MKFSIKRKQNNTDKEVSISKIFLFQKIDEAILRLQYKCANWLERKTEHLSPKSWIVLLICFIGITGTCCIYLIYTSFSIDTNALTIVNITKTVASQPKQDLLKSDIPVSKAEFEKVIRFRIYLDSLGRSPTGKILYDSIVCYRPGLLDSLSIIENYYYSHFKN